MGALPPALAEPFATAMAQALMLPAVVAVLAAVVMLFLKPTPLPGDQEGARLPKPAGRAERES